MSCCWLFATVCVLSVAPVVAFTDVTHQLTTGSLETFSSSLGTAVDFQVKPSSILSSFLVMQVYAQHTTLVLTDTSTLSKGDKVSGNSVGLVKMLDKVVSLYTWKLELGAEGVAPVSYNSSPGNSSNVTVFVLAQEYAENAPVPGACNQVFAVEIDPNIQLTTSSHHTEVWFQWANIGSRRGGALPDCEGKEVESRLSYDVYVNYVDENNIAVGSLSEVLMSMKTVKEIERNAQKIVTLTNDRSQKSLTTVTSQRAQGAVYSVVVRDKYQGLAASYVSAITYGCNFTSGNCDLDYDAMECGMMVACAAVGLFLLCLGHSYLRTELALFGFLAFTLVSFMLLMKLDNLSDGMCLYIAAIIGVIGGMLSFLLWWKFSFPSLSVLLPGLCGGYLVAGCVFYTPFANISWWASDLNYGLTFTCFTLLFAVALLFSPRTLNIISSSLVGGFCITMVPAIATRSSLKLIVLNAIHHSSVPGYATVLVVFPFQVTDIILVGVWIILMVCGIAWQFYMGRGKPAFPNQQRRQRLYRNIPGNHPGIQDEVPPPPAANERTPLLGNQTPPPSYAEATTNPATTIHAGRPPAEMNPIL